MCSIRSLSQLSSPSARLARAAPSRNKILTRKDRSHGSHGLSRAMVAGTATENRPDRKPWLKDGSSSQLSSQGTSWQNNFRESRSPQGERGLTVIAPTSSQCFYESDTSHSKPGGGMKPVTYRPPATANIDDLLVAMRPKLHRDCARMIGSVIDGEDVLQDALIKAVEAFAAAGPIGNPEGWLFRIVHITALDFLRRRSRQEALRSGEGGDMIADPADTAS